MKKLLYFLSLVPVLALAQSTDQNYTKKTTYKVATATLIPNPSVTQANIAVVYFDGLGRPVQQVAHQQSNTGKDIITHIDYDTYGRKIKDFLPFVKANGTISFVPDAGNETLSFYGSPSQSTTGNPNFEATANPFSEKEIEASPLARVFKQVAPGDAWAMGLGKEIKMEYLANTDVDNVHFLKAIATLVNDVYEPSLTSIGIYPESSLYKTITKDENWTLASGKNNTTEEFKNLEGQVVLKRTYNKGDKYDTYYVYDQFGNLTYVFPPMAEDDFSDVVKNNLGYQYKYDYRNRLIEKKLPGKQWEFIIYDNLDRPVATGPAVEPGSGLGTGWLATEYDILGRVTKTGWIKQHTIDTSTRQSIQNTIIAGLNNQLIVDNYNVLTIMYYDNYSFLSIPLPAAIEGQAIAANLKGLPTGTWIKVLDPSNPTASETSYTLYDVRYRPIQSMNNNFLGGYTKTNIKLDWAGKTEYTKTFHKLNANAIEIVTTDTFTYSNQDKLITHAQQINYTPVELITHNEYDELGQLINKKVGGAFTPSATGLQQVDYTYNSRGWLKSINDVNNLSTDLFAFKINYNDPENAENGSLGNTKALFNGNISEIAWKSSNDNVKRKYVFQYDDLNRLLDATYLKPNVSLKNNYSENITYDKNGNIQTLKRTGGLDSSILYSSNPIDDLIYKYDDFNKNLLIKVTDDEPSPQGFKDGANNVLEYRYDENGNMIADDNKGITNIIYNHLNLPMKISFGTLGEINYIYDATGRKVMKKVTENSSIVTTKYLAGGYQYKQDFLVFFPHAEGFVNVIQNASTFMFNYVYNYTDHLGNIRVSYTKDSQTGLLKILEENNYYPFGLKHTNYNSDTYMYAIKSQVTILTQQFGVSSYQYKYNGKELQEELGLNMYAMDARMYDPAIAKWVVQDPVLHESMSPYNAFDNNPVFFKDPSGADAEDGRDDGVVYRGGHWSDNYRSNNTSKEQNNIVQTSKNILKNAENGSSTIIINRVDQFSSVMSAYNSVMRMKAYNDAVFQAFEGDYDKIEKYLIKIYVLLNNVNNTVKKPLSHFHGNVIFDNNYNVVNEGGRDNMINYAWGTPQLKSAKDGRYISGDDNTFDNIKTWGLGQDTYLGGWFAVSFSPESTTNGYAINFIGFRTNDLRKKYVHYWDNIRNNYIIKLQNQNK